MTPITCFYEDDPGVQLANFGPHQLALATIADRVGIDRWTLRNRFNPVPKKGVTKLLAAASLLERGSFALVDDARIRTEIGLQQSDSAAKVLAELKRRAPLTDFVLLGRNIDDLVRAAAVSLSRHVSAGKLELTERDAVLNAAADATPETRAKIVGAIPSWAIGCRSSNVRFLSVTDSDSTDTSANNTTRRSHTECRQPNTLARHSAGSCTASSSIATASRRSLRLADRCRSAGTGS